MKKSFLALVLLLAALQMACSLLGGPAEPAIPAAAGLPTLPPIADLSSPTPTATITDTPGPTETPGPPTETPVPSETPLPPTNTPPPAVPGPEMLDLGRIDLYLPLLSDYTEAYREEIKSKAYGVLPVDMISEYAARYQSRPLPAWKTKMDETFFDYHSERLSINGETYSLYPKDDFCRRGGPHAPESALSQLAGQLTGQAPRVEENVEINGLPADRYAIKNENFAPDAKIIIIDRYINDTSSFTVTVEMHGEGSLWVARQGGYIVRLETSDLLTHHKGKPLPSPVQGYRLLDIVPTRPDEAPIALPAICEALPEKETLTGYPMMDRAEMVVKIPPNQSYKVRRDLAEVQAFYEQEMAAAGWTLATTNVIGPLAELTYTKDGKTVRITLIQTGDMVAVTITDL